MSTEFQKVYQEDGSFKWWETANGRFVDPEYMYLVEWLALNITPDEIVYVTPPTPEEVEEQRQLSKTTKLKQAENAFISFCRSLGLVDQASSSDIEALVMQLKAAGRPLDAIEIAVKSLALINDVTQNDGKWYDIAWHSDI